MKKKKRFKKLHRKKPKIPLYKKKYFKVILVLLLCSASMAYFFLFFDYFWIKEIDIHGSERVEKEELEAFIRENFVQSKVLFNSSSIFLFSPLSALEGIKEKYPEISGMTLRKKYPSTLILNIKERIPVGLWCSEEKCFLIDGSGTVFANSEDRMPLAIKSDREAVLGEKVIAKDDLRSIVIIWNGIFADVEIEEFLVSDSSTTLDLKAKDGWIARFNLEEDVAVQATKLKTVFKERIPPEMRKNLEYIDLRFDNRAYFRYFDRDYLWEESVNAVDEN